MRVASLDLGTNTFLLLVADAKDGKLERVVHDEVRVVRLGQDVHKTRRFHPDALKRADECFRDFAETIERLGAERVLACATSAARDVQNGSELIALAEKHGIPIDIISGEKEAEFTFAGTIEEGERGDVVIIDVGGGSTEFILGDLKGPRARVSVDLGSVRLTELFVTKHPIASGEIDKLAQYMDEHVAKAKASLPAVGPDVKFIAVAGTPTTLATLDQGLAFESERVHGYGLDLTNVENWISRLAAMTVEERQGLAGMEPKRADVIVAGAMILSRSARAFGAKRLQVSIRGLRYGVARFLASQRK